MWFTHTMPARKFFTTRIARKMSRVHTAAARPKWVSFAIRSASCPHRHLRLALADLLVLPDAIHLLAADERPHLRVALDAGPELDGASLLDHRLEEPFVDRPLHENAA